MWPSACGCSLGPDSRRKRDYCGCTNVNISYWISRLVDYSSLRLNCQISINLLLFIQNMPTQQEVFPEVIHLYYAVAVLYNINPYFKFVIVICYCLFTTVLKQHVCLQPNMFCTSRI